jgi:protein gp37
MGFTTKIEWASHTWSPWMGCTNVSAGCEHCYAEAWAKRAGADFVKWGNAPRTRTVNRDSVKWNKRTAGERRICFPSLCDPFDNQVPDEWRADFWSMVADTPALAWTVLTKRPQNIAKMLPTNWGDGWPNVWLGVTTENQIETKGRIPILQSIPAVVRFLSAEPLLEAIEPDLEGIDWVIIGGESGPRRRPINLAWIRSLRDQCLAANVAAFVKQIDGKAPIPPDLMVRQWPAYNLGLSMAG